MKTMVFSITTIILLFSGLCLAQDVQTMTSKADSTDYYYQIPSYPESYTAENVAARLIDGLGFRFYWASEGLRTEDLDFRPSEDARTTGETLDHIFGLSLTIINAAKNEVNQPVEREGMTPDDLRKAALDNIRAASELLKSASKGDIENMNAKFSRRDGGTNELPFWNMINGPIADAVYHSGQITSFRRSSGNPIDPNISMFQGRKRN